MGGSGHGLGKLWQASVEFLGALEFQGWLGAWLHEKWHHSGSECKNAIFY